MKLSLALLWRAFVVQLIFGAVLAALLGVLSVDIARDQLHWKITISATILSITLTSLQFILGFSLVRQVDGESLGLPDQFWRQLTYSLAGFYLCLALANFTLAQTLAFEDWNLYKTFLTPSALIVFMLIIPSLINRSLTQVPR